MKTKKIYLYPRYERFWHWMQAFLVITLVLTGFEVHGTFIILGFGASHYIHELAAIFLMILVVFTIFWHFTTRAWRQYIPTSFKDMKKMFKYYTSGIFKNKAHPFRKTELSKLNPIQRITYLALKIILFPLQIGTGLLYLFYNEMHSTGFGVSLKTISYVHTIGAYLMIVFIIVHVYMTTTGKTPLTNLKAMIRGWEEIDS